MMSKTPANPKFSRLLKAAIKSISALKDKKEEIVEEELGQNIQMSGASINRYKSGSIPSRPVVAMLARAGVQQGLLNQRWLEQFLEVAGYEAPNDLIAKLDCPHFTGPLMTDAPQVRCNGFRTRLATGSRDWNGAASDCTRRQ